MIGFAGLTVYMIFAASLSLHHITGCFRLMSPVYLAVTGIEDVEDEGGVSVGTVFGNKIFRNIVLSLAATYGLYILASILALDPWHMRELRGSDRRAGPHEEQSQVSCNIFW